MPGRNHLFVPGPTNTPHSILNAMHRAMEDHRNPTIPDLTIPLLKDLKKVFKTTEGQVFVYPSTGTGGWEAVITNTMSPGDKILAPRYGQFSHLWIDSCKRLGLDVQVIECEWGTGAPLETIEEILKADTKHEIKAVTICHNETATGVHSDLHGVRKAMNSAGHPALLYADGVSSIGSLDFRFDEWGIDAAVSGSQKGFMLPAGLAIVCMSQKALAMRATATCKRCFFDMEDMINANATGYFPYTPAMPMLHGLRAAVDLMMAEGLENIFARHHRIAEGVRAAVSAWGLKLCAKDPKWYSDTVSAIMVPEGFNGADVVSTAFRRYNLALGAGLNKVAGKLFRIGHLGDLNELMVMSAITGAEMTMRDLGIDVKPGSGSAAAGEYWRKALVSLESAKPKAAAKSTAAA